MLNGDEDRRYGRWLTVAGIAAAVYAASVIGVLMWLQEIRPDSRANFIIPLAAIAVGFVSLIAMLGFNMTWVLRPPEGRPVRFVITAGTFRVRPLGDQRFLAIAMLLTIGPLIGIEWEVGDGSPLRFALTVPLAVVLIVVVGGAWTVGWHPVIELTPSGLRWDARLFRRDIPWEALAPGGPHRPSLHARQLALMTQRPELVTQRGIGLGAGTTRMPLLGLQMRIHPVFLADAIRWYADHPEHRAAIGTQTEHNRLVAALTGAGPSAALVRPKVPQGPAPTLLRIATWLTGAGLTIAALSAITDLVLAISYRPEMIAADRAEMVAEGEDPAGLLLSSADFALLQGVITVIAVVVGGLGALLLLRQVWRGRDAARIGMAVLCGATIIWGICPCGSPDLALSDIMPIAMTAVFSSLLARSAILLLAVATLVLLLTSSVATYTRQPTT
jgi:hypothetical protein